MGGWGQAGAPGEGGRCRSALLGERPRPQTPVSWCERCLSPGEISAWLGPRLRGPAVPLLLELSLSPAFTATRPPDLASWLTCRGLPLACPSHLVAVTESNARGKACTEWEAFVIGHRGQWRGALLGRGSRLTRRPGSSRSAMAPGGMGACAGDSRRVSDGRIFTGGFMFLT